MEETIGTLLLQLPDDIILKILNNMKIQRRTNYLSKHGKTIHDAINNSIDWSITPEGSAYWLDLYKYYENEYYNKQTL